jgi:hypothetical protein
MFKSLHPKCANFTCDSAFDWTAGGKFFRFQRTPSHTEFPAVDSDRFNNHHKVEHFWLCERCCRIYTLDYQPGLGVSIRLLWPELPEAEKKMHLPAS